MKSVKKGKYFSDYYSNEEIENMAMIASYIDYLMNLEENKSPQLSDARPISRWREFGLQKGVLRI